LPATVAPGRDEIADLAAEQERADVLCEFCRERYEFGREELERILTQRGEGKPPGES
jgi:molecular chaperone Hsp33